MSQRPLTFDPCFGKLGREVERFANHTRRQIRVSLKHRPILEEASAWSEGAAPLDRSPDSPSDAMRAIDKFARMRRENRTSLFGAYFGHHDLRNQAHLSRELLRKSFRSEAPERIAACHEHYERGDAQRREWVSALLDLSIAAAAPDLAKRDYAAFNVGALTDREDVDLAIVVRTEEAREALSRGFATVAKTFLRFSSKIQMFLTEELTSPRSGALVEEYAELLEHPTRSVVAVMQLLGAQYLCGERTLARALEERVIHNYYAGQGRPIVHEGFLRSVMSEMRHFLVPRTVPGVLSPKREIYVPGKLATTAARVIHGVHETRPPVALRLLADKDPEYAETYLALADAFAQNEVVRALMFLYVFPADQFDLSDADVRSASNRVAHLMGFEASARRLPQDRLAGVYAENRTRALRAISTLSTKIVRHLARVSTFRRLIEREQGLGPGENLALRLVRELESFKGSVFWDEVVELLASRRAVGERFTEDFDRIPEGRTDGIARRYVEMMVEDAASLVELLVFLAQRDLERLDEDPPRPAGTLARLFWRHMMAHLCEDPVALESFVQRLDTEATSDSLFRLATVFLPGDLAALSDLIEESDQSARGAHVVRTLRSVLVLVHHRSNAVGRIANRVLARTPEFMPRLGDARRLKELAAEVLAQAARERNPLVQIDLLGDSYDVAALRGALIAVLEGAPAARDAELTNAVDQYVRELFKACFREVHQRSPMFEHYRPGSRIAVYATGGYGRGEAFGADWDYLAVVDSDDRGLKKFFGKVLQRVSAAMTRRGLHPHNRFTDHFNTYVVSVSELVEHLSRRTRDTFIDEAEVLEARFFLGDPAVARSFHEEAREHVTVTHARDFILDILNELEDRRKRPPAGLNVKLGPGGLRELHLMFLALRVHAMLPGPLVPELLSAAADALPSCRSDLRFLMVAQAELRRARELYRLLVAFDDSMQPESLVAIARDLAPLKQAGIRGNLRRQIEKLMTATALRVDRVATEMKRELGS